MVSILCSRFELLYKRTKIIAAKGLGKHDLHIHIEKFYTSDDFYQHCVGSIFLSVNKLYYTIAEAILGRVSTLSTADILAMFSSTAH